VSDIVNSVVSGGCFKSRFVVVVVVVVVVEVEEGDSTVVGEERR
jgi:hypothetical protein